MLKSGIIPSIALGMALAVPTPASAQRSEQRSTQPTQSGQDMPRGSTSGGASGSSTGSNSMDQDIRGFMVQAEQTMLKAVQDGDASAIRRWTEANVSEGASFATMMQVTGSGRLAKGMRVAIVDKQDLLRRQSAMMSLMPDLLNQVSNYDIAIRILSIEPVGDNAAIVKLRINEGGSIGAPSTAAMSERQGRQAAQLSAPDSQSPGSSDQTRDAASSGAGSGQQSAGQYPRGMRLTFNGTAECTQLLRRDQLAGHLTIGMSNCSAELMQ